MSVEAVSAAPPEQRGLTTWSARRPVLLRPAGALSLIMIVVLGALVAPPMFTLLKNSFSVLNIDGSSGAFTLDNYTRLLSDPKLYVSARNSVTFAALTTIVALLLGGSLAWVVERTNAPLRGLAYLTSFVSLGMPFILYVLTWLFLLGRAGPVNDLYRTLTGETANLVNPHSMTGMVLVGAFGWLPLVFLLCAASFRAANAEMEEAARMSGASLFDMIWRVSLRLAWPAILATALFVFIRSLEAFDVPMLIGKPGGINLLTTDIYYSVRKVPPDINHASAYAVTLTVAIGVLMYFYSRLSRNADRYATVTGKGYRPRPLDLGWARWLGGAVILFNFIVVLALPLIVLLWLSFMPFVRSIRWSALPFATTKNYLAVLNDAGYIKLVINTLITASAAATVTMLLMLVVGWLVARRKPGAALLDQMTTMPLLLPGIVLGVAVMETALRLPVPLYGTITLIVIAFVIGYMPYGMRYAFSGVLQIHRELEEAANVSGANGLEMLRRVIGPLLLPALLSGWLFIFLNASRELTVAILLAGPHSQMMAVAFFDLSNNGQLSEVAALGLLWTGFMTLFAVIFYFIMRRRSAGAFGA